MKKKALLHCDGASLGNPGPSGIGFVLEVDGKTYEASAHIGHATNNIAEYTALLRGLEKAKSLKAEAIDVYLDSELVVRQMKGIYRVRDKKLIALYMKAAELMKSFGNFSITHIPREENKRADALSKKAAKQEHLGG